MLGSFLSNFDFLVNFTRLLSALSAAFRFPTFLKKRNMDMTLALTTKTHTNVKNETRMSLRFCDEQSNLKLMLHNQFKITKSLKKH